MFKHAITSAAKAFGTQSRNLTAASNQSVVKRSSGRSESQRNYHQASISSTTATTERRHGFILGEQRRTTSHLSRATTIQSNNVEARVRAVIGGQLSISEEDVLPSKHFETDLGVNDRTFLKLCMALEEEFGVGIKASVINNINTVQDAVQYLESSQLATQQWSSGSASPAELSRQVSNNSTWSNKDMIIAHPQFVPGRTMHANTWPSERKETSTRKPEQERPG